MVFWGMTHSHLSAAFVQAWQSHLEPLLFKDSASVLTLFETGMALLPAARMPDPAFLPLWNALLGCSEGQCRKAFEGAAKALFDYAQPWSFGADLAWKALEEATERECLGAVHLLMVSSGNPWEPGVEGFAPTAQSEAAWATVVRAAGSRHVSPSPKTLEILQLFLERVGLTESKKGIALACAYNGPTVRLLVAHGASFEGLSEDAVKEMLRRWGAGLTVPKMLPGIADAVDAWPQLPSPGLHAHWGETLLSGTAAYLGKTGAQPILAHRIDHIPDWRRLLKTLARQARLWGHPPHRALANGRTWAGRICEEMVCHSGPDSDTALPPSSRPSEWLPRLGSADKWCPGPEDAAWLLLAEAVSGPSALGRRHFRKVLGAHWETAVEALPALLAPTVQQGNGAKRIGLAVCRILPMLDSVQTRHWARTLATALPALFQFPDAHGWYHASHSTWRQGAHDTPSWEKTSGVFLDSALASGEPAVGFETILWAMAAGRTKELMATGWKANLSDEDIAVLSSFEIGQESLEALLARERAIRLQRTCDASLPCPSARLKCRM